MEISDNNHMRKWFSETSDSQNLLFFTIVIVGLITVTVIRLYLITDLPLWLDETWTVMISSQPTWQAFWHEAWLDCNPPLYYLVEALWIQLAGNSNFALRLPSLLFVYLAAAAPLIWRVPGLNKSGAITWGMLLVLWWPGISISLDARSYSMMLFLATVQAVAFVNIYCQLDGRRVLLWTCLSSAMVLTHYFAGALILVQSLILLARYRWRVFSHAYGVVPFIPTAVWSIYHIPRVLEYARPDIIWYEATTAWSAISYGMFTIGPPTIYFVLLLIGALLGVFWLSGWKVEPLSEDRRVEMRALEWTGIAAVSAYGLLILFGTFNPSLADRYFVPLVPSMLLFLVTITIRLTMQKLALVSLMSIYLAGSLTTSGLQRRLEGRANYGFEMGSKFIARYNPTDVVFFWDHPATKILDPNSLSQLGGFFLHRTGVPAVVHVLELDEASDPNVALVRATKGERPAFIWLYNAARRSVAKEYPPTISMDSGWQCYDLRTYSSYEELSVGMLVD